MFIRIKSARFFDNKGEYIGVKRFIKKTAQTFNYAEGSYVLDTKNLSYYEDNWLLLFKRRTYFYTLDKPYPMNFNRNVSSKDLNSEQLNVILETNAVKKLNALAKPGFFEKVNWKVIGIFVLVLIVLGYAQQHGGVVNFLTGGG